MTIKQGKHFTCPECGEVWEYPIEDYAVPGLVGSRSISDETCCGCDKEFTVENLGKGVFDVEEV